MGGGLWCPLTVAPPAHADCPPKEWSRMPAEKNFFSNHARDGCCPFLRRKRKRGEQALCFDHDVQCKDKVFVQGRQYAGKLREYWCLKRKDLLCDMEGDIELDC